MPQSKEEQRDTDCAPRKSGIESHFRFDGRLDDLRKRAAHLFEEGLDDIILFLHLYIEVLELPEK